jgi:hypothetical protein
MRHTLIFAVAILGLLLALTAQPGFAQTSQCDSVIFFDDFEGAVGGWSVDNGLWALGVDTVARWHSPQRVYGTEINGRIPNDTYTTRLYRIVTLPAVSSNQELRLRFWSWFDRQNSVRASVHVKVDTGGGHFTDWKRVTQEMTTVRSPWTSCSVELTQFSGKQIYLGFALSATYSGPYPAGGLGWYIDDVKVVKTAVSSATPVAWDFEVDSTMCRDYYEKWWGDNFLWQLGNSTLVQPRIDTTCAGTVLNGNIPNDTYTTRLVSPPVLIPPNSGSGMRLRYFYAFNRENNVTATVEFSIDSGGGRWSDFQDTLAGPYTANTSWARTSQIIPVSLAGKRVQFGFALNATYSGPYPAGGLGLYIDDVDIFHADSLPRIPVVFRFPKDSVGNSLRPVLRWHLSPGAELYQIQIATNSSFTNVIRDTTTDSLHWTVRPPLATTGNYYYRVRAMNGNGNSGWTNPPEIISNVRELSSTVPEVFTLSQNYPNPFNPETKIKFQIPTSSDVVLQVFDVLGREVKTLVNERLQPGSYETTFDGKDLSSGVYLYRLQAGGFVETKKLLLLR